MSSSKSHRNSIRQLTLAGIGIASGFLAYRLWTKYSRIPCKEWLQSCPKLELHAHLHGSIRMETLAELYENASKDETLKHLIKEHEDPQRKIQQILKKHKTFNEVFPLFDVIHRVVCSKDVLVRIINEVLLDFAMQNVKYLELRSTPRRLQVSGHSRSDYVDIILHEIRNFPVKHPEFKDMIIRFIVTMQNGKPLKEAEESLDIIEQYIATHSDPDPLIVGIDFAPRQHKGKTFKYFESTLQRARRMGLKITIHFAEYYDRKEQDLVLSFRPNRLGHAVNLKKEDYRILLNEPIFIEMCPTSNIFTRSIADYIDHPFKDLKKRIKQKYGNQAMYPMLFCTDDFGIFETDLVTEWERMCNAHALSKKEVKEITMNAIDYIFASKDVKDKLRANLRKQWDI